MVETAHGGYPISEAKRLADEHMRSLGYTHNETYFSGSQDAFFMAACASAGVDTSDAFFTEDEIRCVAKHMADDQAHIDEIERLSWEITAETIEEGIDRDPLVIEWIIDEVARTFLDRHNSDWDSQNILPRDMRPTFYYLAADLEILIVKERHETISPWKERNYVWPVDARDDMLNGLLERYEAEYTRVRKIRDDERLGLLRQIARNSGEPLPDAIPEGETRTSAQLLEAARAARREARQKRLAAEDERRRKREEKRAEAARRGAIATARREAEIARQKAAQKASESEGGAHWTAQAQEYARLIGDAYRQRIKGSRNEAAELLNMLRMALAQGGPAAEGARLYAHENGIDLE